MGLGDLFEKNNKMAKAHIHKHIITGYSCYYIVLE
jgi:hypothetical protein